MICSNCNMMNANRMKFCGNCGAPLDMSLPKGQPLMQPGYGQQMHPRMTVAAAAGEKGMGGGGLKASLIAVCLVLAVAVAVPALFMTGVFAPGKNRADSKADVAGIHEAYGRSGGGAGAVFEGQYRDLQAGRVSNIREQSGGWVFSLETEDASFTGAAVYDERTGRLLFDDAVEAASGSRVSGYVESDGDSGIRVTFTASDIAWITEGDVYTLERVKFHFGGDA